MLPVDVIVKKIVIAMMNYRKDISFTVNSRKDINGIIDMVRYENVATFHVGDIMYNYNPYSKEVILRPRYLYKQNDYRSLINKILAKLNEMKTEIMKFPSELAREKYIHDYLCKKVVYKEIGPDAHCVLGPLFKGEGVCEGIAKTAQALLNTVGINSHIICGDALEKDGRKTPHAWNVVQINGHWHLLDITYDNTLSDPNFIRYDYFNVTAKELSLTHTPYDYCQEHFYKCITSKTYFSIFNLEFATYQAVCDYARREINKKAAYLYFKYINKTSPIRIDVLVNYVLNLPNVNRVSYSYDEGTGIYLFEVFYNQSFLKNPLKK